MPRRRWDMTSLDLDPNSGYLLLRPPECCCCFWKCSIYTDMWNFFSNFFFSWSRSYFWSFAFILVKMNETRPLCPHFLLSRCQTILFNVLEERQCVLKLFSKKLNSFFMENWFLLIKKKHKISIFDFKKSHRFCSFFPQKRFFTSPRAALPASWRNRWGLLTFLQTINCGNCFGTAITSEFDGGDKSNRQSWFIPLFTTVRWLFDFTQLNLTLMTMMHHKHLRR